MTKNKQLLSLIIFFGFVLFFNIDIYKFTTAIIEQFEQYVYPLDDAYIHLAIAKNLSEYGVWGLTKHEFSNTSSSPFFTIIISSLIRLFGNNQILLLFLNLVLANTLYFLLFIFFRQKPLQLLLVYLSFYFFVLMRIQVLSGMEHTLQVFFISTSWIVFLKWVESEFKKNHLIYIFYFLSFFLCITRYESMFFIVPITGVLIYLKLYKQAIILSILSILPVIFFGIYFIQNGSHFFPNSLLIKGNHSIEIIHLMKSFAYSIYKIFLFPLSIMLFIFVLYVLYSIKDSLNRKIDLLKIPIHDKSILILLVIFFCLFFHLMFAKIGWLYRYEAYLMALISITFIWFGNKIVSILPRNILVLSFILLFVLMFRASKRYEHSAHQMEYANKNINDQQIQMSKFVNLYYNNSTVVANDIGAISYFSNIKIIDLIGLGSNDILNLILKKDDKLIEDYLIRNPYDLLMIYDNLGLNINFKKNNVKIGELELKDNVICGGSIVSFYAPKNKAKMRYTYDSLQDFKTKIPKDVNLKIFEIDTNYF